METVRQNFQISVELKSYIESQSKVMGISQSAFISICISQYKQNQDALLAMKNVSGLVEQLSSMKDVMIELQSNENKKMLAEKK